MESEKKLFKARILSFIDPHFFWFIRKSDILKRNELSENLKVALKTPTKAKAVLEKRVAVYDNLWKRAIIKEISDGNYSCWLEDYGYLIITNNIYEFPEKFQIDPSPLAFQACFCDIVPLKSHLSSEHLGVEYTETDTFSPGAVCSAFKYICQSVDIVVECNGVYNGIYHVNLLAETKNCDIIDLKDMMIKKNFAVENKEMFNTVLPKLKLSTENLLKLFKDSSPVIDQLPNEVENAVIAFKDMRARRIKSVPTNLVCMDTFKNALQNDIETDQLINNTNVDKDAESDTYSVCSNSCSSNSSTNEDLRMGHSLSYISTNSNTETDNDVISDNNANERNDSTTGKDCSTIANDAENFWDDGEHKEIKAKALNFFPTTNFFMNTKKASPKTKKVHQIINKTENNITHLSDNAPSTSCFKNAPNNASEIKNICENTNTVKIDGNENGGFHSKSSESKECKPVFGNECKCKECKQWNGENTSWFDDKIVFNNFEEKCHRTAVKPKSFLRQNCDEDNYNFAVHFLSYQMHSKLEREYLPPVLVHGCLINGPADKISDVAFHPSVERALLRLKFTKCKHIQSYTWPAILKNLNVCAINGPKSGKTMMYLPCVATILIENGDVFKKFTNSNGPVIVIMCSNIKNVENVKNVLDELLKFCNKTVTVALSVPPFDQDCLNQFKKKCDILITTPLTLKYLLTKQVINLRRLCHIIFDDFDKILDKHYVEIDTLLKIIQNVIEHRVCEVSVQYIVTAECWTKKLESMIKKLNVPPFICIGAPLEAALYGKISFEVKFIQSYNKEKELLEIIKNKSQIKKTIVVCNCDEEVVKLTSLLQQNCVPVLKIKSNLTRVEIADHESSWLNCSSGEYLVMICTDTLFYNSSIRDADTLINYSLPSLWSDFTNRYKVLLDKFSSSIYDLKDKGNHDCKSYVFIDEKFEKKIVRFISFFQKMGFTFHEKFIQYQQDCILHEEKQKCEKRTGLCRRLKAFGKCLKEKCEKRHLIDKDVDTIKKNSQSGLIKFKIISVHNINHYTIRLINNTSEPDSIQKKLERALKERKIYADDIKQGDWLIYCDNSTNNKPQRCEVLQILKTDSITKMVSLCKIKLLDSGEVLSAIDETLFELPEEFKEIPPEGTEMFLGNIVPPFSDSEFSTYSKKTLEKKFLTFKDSIYCGDVLLRLGNTLWMKNVHTVKQLPLYDLEVCEFDLSNFILKNKLAENSEEPLSLLFKICERSGISVPTTHEKKQEETNNGPSTTPKITPQQAFLDKGTYQDVWITHVKTPDCFFVHLDKFRTLINRLEKNMLKIISSQLCKKADKVLVGHIYIAKLNNNNCRRIKVVRTNNRVAKCFCVDYGECVPVKISNIFPIKEDMITSLPFQAIKCRLFGITAINEWHDEDAKHIWQYCDGYNSPFYAWTEKIENSPDRESTLYSVLLSKICGDVTLNQILVDSGIAKILESEYYDIYTSEVVENNDCTSGSNEEYSDENDVEPDVNPNSLYTTLEDILKLEEIVNRDADALDLDRFDFYDSRFEDVSNSLPQQPHKKKTRSDREEHEYLPMVAAPIVNYYTPSLYWYQTDENIIIKILLSGIQKHEFNINLHRKRILKFSANYQEKKYQLQLPFFNIVKNKHPTVTTTGCYIKVVLTKVDKAKWPRLLASVGRARNITYDPSHLCDDLDEDEEESILSKIKNNRINKNEDYEELEDCYIEELCDTDTTDSFSDEELSDY